MFPSLRPRTDIQAEHFRHHLFILAMRQATSVYDWDSIFKYLNIAPCDIPNGAKGKRKMKKLFRSVGRGIAYHEGVRAKKLIEALNFEVIIEKAPLNFSKIEQECFVGC